MEQLIKNIKNKKSEKDIKKVRIFEKIIPFLEKKELFFQ